MLSCTECLFTTKSKDTLNTHKRSLHRAKILLNCKLCNYETTFSQALTVHIDVKHHKINYPCDKCDFKSLYERTWKRHMKNVHGVEQRSKN